MQLSVLLYLYNNNVCVLVSNSYMANIFTASQNLFIYLTQSVWDSGNGHLKHNNNNDDDDDNNNNKNKNKNNNHNHNHNNNNHNNNHNNNNNNITYHIIIIYNHYIINININNIVSLYHIHIDII